MALYTSDYTGAQIDASILNSTNHAANVSNPHVTTLTQAVAAGGTVPIANGGTGATARLAALVALLGSTAAAQADADSAPSDGVFGTDTNTTHLPTSTYGILIAVSALSGWKYQIWTDISAVYWYYRVNINAAGWSTWRMFYTEGSSGILGTGTALSGTSGAVTATMDSRLKTLTPAGNCTINATGGVLAQACTFDITTSGTSSYTLTFGTSFKSTGTLATGTVTAKKFTVSFIYDSTNWCETGRTAAM
jgi:hypothetical protein